MVFGIAGVTNVPGMPMPMSSSLAMPAEPLVACAVVTPLSSSPREQITRPDVTLAKDPLGDDSLDLVEQMSPGTASLIVLSSHFTVLLTLFVVWFFKSVGHASVIGVFCTFSRCNRKKPGPSARY